MDGAATLTIVPSSRSMHSAARTTKRISQRCGWPRDSAPVAAGGSGEVRTSDIERTPFVVDEPCSNDRMVFVSSPHEDMGLPIPPWSARRRRPARDRTPLSRDAIVDAAMAILDAEGLDALTMRRVATALGTGPASLYAHVAGKDELLELMIDRVAAELEVPDPDPDHWQEQVKDGIRGMYRGFL